MVNDLRDFHCLGELLGKWVCSIALWVPKDSIIGVMLNGNSDINAARRMSLSRLLQS